MYALRGLPARPFAPDKTYAACGGDSGGPLFRGFLGFGPVYGAAESSTCENEPQTSFYTGLHDPEVLAWLREARGDFCRPLYSIKAQVYRPEDSSRIVGTMSDGGALACPRGGAPCEARDLPEDEVELRVREDGVRPGWGRRNIDGECPCANAQSRTCRFHLDDPRREQELCGYRCVAMFGPPCSPAIAPARYRSRAGGGCYNLGGKRCAEGPTQMLPFGNATYPPGHGLAPPPGAFAQYGGGEWRLMLYIRLDDLPSRVLRPVEVVAKGTVSAGGELLEAPAELEARTLGNAPAGAGYDCVGYECRMELSCDGVKWPSKLGFGPCN